MDWISEVLLQGVWEAEYDQPQKSVDENQSSMVGL